MIRRPKDQWYIARCEDCGTPPQTFTSETARADWARTHVRATEHTVVKATRPFDFGDEEVAAQVAVYERAAMSRPNHVAEQEALDRARLARQNGTTARWPQDEP